MYIYPNTNYQAAAKTDSPIFQAVENEFWKWLNSTNPAMEYSDMYFSEDAIYDKKSAIRGAIEELIAEAEETGKPVLLSKFDFDAVFA